MSGGVDSSVAAMLLQRDGYRVVGVTLQLWDDPTASGDRTCCSADAVQRARSVAHQLRIPHLTVDARDIFREQVVEYFVGEYGVGRTPNPCAKCNSRVRFEFMLGLARKLGLEHLATGHYARLTGDPAGLTRGVDRNKDQSYVLAEVAPELLRQVLFPLGELTKPQVRSLADEGGLAGRSARESQEICFIPDDDHHRFLEERLGKRPGAIVDELGHPRGRHLGTYRFTIGQRKGLGVAHGVPLYVVALDAERREVTVGERDALAVGVVHIDGVVSHRPPMGTQLSVQLRSSGETVPAHLRDAGTIVLERPASGVASGQTAVLYEGEHVVLAGTILGTEA
jgi:tRNA-specific 2-thiouridylase